MSDDRICTCCSASDPNKCSWPKVEKVNDAGMPEEVVCYYVPGRISQLHVADELYEKDWLQGQYRLRSAEDKTIKELAEAAKAFQELNGCYRLSKQPSEALFNRLKKAKETLSDNAVRIQQAKDNLP